MSASRHFQQFAVHRIWQIDVYRSRSAASSYSMANFRVILKGPNPVNRATRSSGRPPPAQKSRPTWTLCNRGSEVGLEQTVHLLYQCMFGEFPWGRVSFAAEKPAKPARIGHGILQPPRYRQRKRFLLNPSELCELIRSTARQT